MIKQKWARAWRAPASGELCLGVTSENTSRERSEQSNTAFRSDDGASIQAPREQTLINQRS